MDIFREILELEGRLCFPMPHFKIFITGVSIDTRTIKEGNLYFAIKGENFDGHDFVWEAYEKGASICFVNEDWHEKNNENLKHYFSKCVKDTTVALANLSKDYRKKFGIPFIAVGGSNGKTTTKEMIAAVLSPKYKVLKTEGNLNNHIGVPLTLFRLDDTFQIAVIEIGTNHFHELTYLCSILEPDYGMLTNIGREHLEFFKDINGVAEAEGELIHYLIKNHKKGILNTDDKHIFHSAKGLRHRLSYGFHGNVAVKGEFLGLDRLAMPTFSVTFKKNTTKIKLKVPGEHSIHNALAAAAIGFEFGVSAKQIKIALESFLSYNKRMEVLKTNGITIINDCYNANPDSMIAAIKTLEHIKTKGNRIAVLGDMAELGNTSKIGHQEVGKIISVSNINYFLSIGKDMKHAHEIADTIMENAIHFESNKVLIEFLRFAAEAGDILLIKGSRSMRMEEIVAAMNS